MTLIRSFNIYIYVCVCKIQIDVQSSNPCPISTSQTYIPQALVSFKKYMPPPSPPLPYFKVNICPLPLPHFASIFFAYL